MTTGSLRLVGLSTYAGPCQSIVNSNSPKGRRTVRRIGNRRSRMGAQDRSSHSRCGPDMLGAMNAYGPGRAAAPNGGLQSSKARRREAVLCPSSADSYRCFFPATTGCAGIKLSHVPHIRGETTNRMKEPENELTVECGGRLKPVFPATRSVKLGLRGLVLMVCLVTPSNDGWCNRQRSAWLAWGWTMFGHGSLDTLADGRRSRRGSKKEVMV